MDIVQIYIQDEQQPFNEVEIHPINIAELLNKIIAEGKHKVSEKFKAFKSNLNYKLSRFDHIPEKKIEIINKAIESLNLTYEFSSYASSSSRLKKYIAESLKSVIHQDGEYFVLWKHQIEIQVTFVTSLLMEIKKEQYLLKLADELASKPDEEEKIEWLGLASEFGLLINELEKKGYIKKSSHKRVSNKDSWSRTAKLLFETFKVPNQTRDGETSEENLRKEISAPSLTDKEHGFFKITRENHK
jgi:hypothetical protein